MKTHSDYSSLGEGKGNFTNSSVRPGKVPALSPENIKNSINVSGSNAKLALGLLAGAGVGVLAGMLLAPNKGTETRKMVADSASKLGDQVNKGFQATKVKVSDWTARSKPKQEGDYMTRMNQSQSTDLKSSGTSTLNVAD